MSEILKLETKLPATRFIVGDIITVPNIKNNKCLFFLVTKIIYLGNFVFCHACNTKYASVQKVDYEVSHQQNSFLDQEFLYPIRPGKLSRYSVSFVEKGSKVEYFPYEIIEADTPENIKEREKEWRSNISQIRKELK